MTRSPGRGHRTTSSAAAPTHAPTTVTDIVTAIATAGVSALVSHGLLRASRRLPDHLRDPWSRTNHAGRPVTLLEGPAWVAGGTAGALVGALVGSVVDSAVLSSGAAIGLGSHRGPSRGSSALATAVVAGAGGGLGALDDLAGGASDKGLKGHLGALSRGEVTTGAVKIVGLGLTGLVGAAIADHGSRTKDGPRRPRGLLSTLVGGAVIAGAANAVNLFDLRPGRALKVTVVAGLPLATSGSAAAAVGSSLGVAGDDLAATSMLGDTGANAAGALIGLAVVEQCGLFGRALALAGLAALTVASEHVSFTKVIEGNATLRRIDEWGRSAR